MAIGTPVHVTNQAAASGVNTATTGAFVPAASSIIWAWISSRDPAATPADAVITDSLGLTWTKVTSVTGPLSNAFLKGVLWWATSTNTSMTVTGTVTGSTTPTICVEIVTVPMGTPDTSNTAGSADAAGDPSCVLSGTPAAAICFVTAQTGNTFTQSTGYTEIVDANPPGVTSALHQCVAYDLTSPNATCTMTSTNVNTIGLSLELKESTGNQTVTGVLFTDADSFFSATVAFPSQTITASRLTLTNSFFGASLASVATVTGVLYINPDTFFPATITGGAVSSGGDGFSLILRRRRRYGRRH